jgi:hypothetical protein
LLTMNEKQCAERESTNKLILRRLAILQLREANELAKWESINAKVDELGQSHREKLKQRVLEAQTAVEHWTFDPVKRDIEKNLGECFFQTVSKQRLVVNHDQNVKAVVMAREQKAEEEARATAARIAEAKRRHEALTQALLGERQKRLDKNDGHAPVISDRWAEREKRLQERAALREERHKIVTRNGAKFVQDEIEKARNKLAEEAEKSRVVQAGHQAEIQQKIEIEKKAMERRLLAAQQTFHERDGRLKEYERALSRRDVKIEENRSTKERELKERLTNERFELEQKSAIVQRARGASDLKAATTLRQKLARSSLGIGDTKKQRAQSQNSFFEADETFAEAKAAVLGLLPRLVEMNERQRIRALMEAMRCTEEEAAEVIEAAKAPPSQH